MLWAGAALLAGTIFLLPVVAMLAGSLRAPGLPPATGTELLPADPGLEAYERAFDVAPLAQGLLNSLLVAALFVPLALATAAGAGYALSRLHGRALRWAIGGLVVLLMIPASALWVPRFVLFDAVGLTGTWAPLIAPALLGASPVLILLYAIAFRRLPREVVDAARIEGASEWRAFRTVALPLVRRTTVACALLAFVLSWASFIDPLLYLTDERTYTAPLILRSVQQLGPSDWSTILAAAAVVTAPVAIAFAFALRRLAPRRGAGWLAG